MRQLPKNSGPFTVSEKSLTAAKKTSLDANEGWSALEWFALLSCYCTAPLLAKTGEKGQRAFDIIQLYSLAIAKTKHRTDQSCQLLLEEFFIFLRTTVPNISLDVIFTFINTFVAEKKAPLHAPVGDLLPLHRSAAFGEFHLNAFPEDVVPFFFHCSHLFQVHFDIGRDNRSLSLTLKESFPLPCCRPMIWRSFYARMLPSTNRWSCPRHSPNCSCPLTRSFRRRAGHSIGYKALPHPTRHSTRNAFFFCLHALFVWFCPSPCCLILVRRRWKEATGKKKQRGNAL